MSLKSSKLQGASTVQDILIVLSQAEPHLHGDCFARVALYVHAEIQIC